MKRGLALLCVSGISLALGCAGAETVEQEPATATQTPMGTTTEDSDDADDDTVRPTQGDPSDPVDDDDDPPAETETDPPPDTDSDTEGDTDTDTDGDTDVDTADPVEPVPCTGGGNDLTAQGTVTASTVFSAEFPPTLAVDASRTTSWFSAGPGRDGSSTFIWTAPATVCMTTLEFAGNGMHEMEEFREDFGFEMLTVRIFDANDDLIFVEEAALPGTPDPQQSIDLGSIEGVRIELEMSGHEDPICGGFSELAVLGA